MKHLDFTSSANRIQNTACSREHQVTIYLKNRKKGQVNFFAATDVKFHKGGTEFYVTNNMSWLLLLLILTTVKCLVLILKQLTATNKRNRNKQTNKHKRQKNFQAFMEETEDQDR